MACLNHLVTDALKHIPDVFIFMGRLRDPTVFNFCAIPQTMAIATLSVCYDNAQVFRGVVKIRKGEAVSLMLEGTSMPALYAIFARYVTALQPRVRPEDPSAQATATILQVSRRAVVSPATHRRAYLRPPCQQMQRRQHVQGLLAAKREAGEFPPPVPTNTTLRVAVFGAAVAALAWQYFL